MNIPLADKPKFRFSPIAETKDDPESWSIALTGTRDGLLKAIAAKQDVPERWRTVVAAELASFDPKFNFFQIDAHCHKPENRAVLHLTIIPSVAVV